MLLSGPITIQFSVFTYVKNTIFVITRHSVRWNTCITWVHGQLSPKRKKNPLDVYRFDEVEPYQSARERWWYLKSAFISYRLGRDVNWRRRCGVAVAGQAPLTRSLSRGWPRSKPPTLPKRVGIQNTLKSFLDVPQSGFGRCDLIVESGGEESENDGFSLVAIAVETRSSSTQIYPGPHHHLHLHAWWVNWSVFGNTRSWFTFPRRFHPVDQHGSGLGPPWLHTLHNF